jgi:hypothetical protein
MTTVNIHYRIELFGQPTDMTCWSAALTMLFGNRFSAGPGRAATDKKGGLQPSFGNLQELTRAYGLTLYAPQSWTVEGLITLLHKGPVIMMGYMPSGHAIVIGGIAGDGTAKGTTLTIYDPWPPSTKKVPGGKIYRANYAQLMTAFPMASTYLLQR